MKCTLFKFKKLKIFYFLKKIFILEEDLEFEIISSNQKRWEFSATTMEERDEWVRLIEEIIERCIQSQQSQKEQKNSRVSFLL